MAAPSPGLKSFSSLSKICPSPMKMSPTIRKDASFSTWTPQHDKLFEKALARYDENTPDRWEKVAATITGKDAGQVKQHYELLLEDVNCIETGRVPLPSYSSTSLEATGDQTMLTGENSGLETPAVAFHADHSTGVVANNAGLGNAKACGKQSEQERRKGIPWTEEEHRFFLDFEMFFRAVEGR
eukprot:c53236_g1_i1 orf=575-1126(+)